MKKEIDIASLALYQRHDGWNLFLRVNGREFINLSSKGVFCIDVDTEIQEYYKEVKINDFFSDKKNILNYNQQINTLKNLSEIFIVSDKYNVLRDINRKIKKYINISDIRASKDKEPIVQKTESTFFNKKERMGYKYKNKMLYNDLGAIDLLSYHEIFYDRVKWEIVLKKKDGTSSFTERYPASRKTFKEAQEAFLDKHVVIY